MIIGERKHFEYDKICGMIVDIMCRVGQCLSKFTTGKVPKAFKHIPSMQLWEDVLYLTEPENWSPAAMFEGTKMFSSNLGSKKVERFYRLVLLPRIRDDIRKHKRLHFMLYQALKKSLYKPAAFNKGILLPLCKVYTSMKIFRMVFNLSSDNTVPSYANMCNLPCSLPLHPNGDELTTALLCSEKNK